MKGFLSALCRIADSVCAVVFARKCAGCRTRIRAGALCDACIQQLVQAVHAACPSCGQTVSGCRCTALDGGSVPVYSLFPYRVGGGDAASRMLLARKHRLNLAAEAFLAQMMEPLCRRVTAEYGTDADWVLTYPPRSK